jgi:hypothetical protein
MKTSTQTSLSHTGAQNLISNLHGMATGMDSSGAGQQQIGANMFSGMSDQVL